MSKFIERLKQVFQPASLPMGFGAAKAASERPKIQLVVQAPEAVIGQITAADALIISPAKKIAPEKPWGQWVKKGDAEEIDRAIKAKADFVLLPFTGFVVPAEAKIGKILQLEAIATDIELRAANELPVDAFILGQSQPGALTWQRLTAITRFGGLLTKPALVGVPLTVNAAELQLIWEAGISGVIVEAADDSGVESIVKLREMINGLAYPVKKRKEKMAATLPAVLKPAHEEHEEPDEDDDDE